MGHTVAKLGTGGDGRQARTRRTVHNHAMWGLWPSGRSTGYRPHNVSALHRAGTQCGAMVDLLAP